MKHMKKFLAFLTLCVLFFAPLLSHPLSAYAAESETYYVKYVDSLSQFRYQKGSWQDGQEHFDVAVLSSNIKDGDQLVIDGVNGQGISLSVNVKLESLTVANANVAVITAKSINNVYVLNGSAAAINGDVTTANLYGDCSVNFNNNLKCLNLYYSSTISPTSDVNVLGTCDELHIEQSSNAYSFKRNALIIRDGELRSDTNLFSFTAPSSTSASSSLGSEYDDVPKTGDAQFNPLWLVCLSAICLSGAYFLGYSCNKKNERLK